MRRERKRQRENVGERERTAETGMTVTEDRMEETIDTTGETVEEEEEEEGHIHTETQGERGALSGVEETILVANFVYLFLPVQSRYVLPLFF